MPDFVIPVIISLFVVNILFVIFKGSAIVDKGFKINYFYCNTSYIGKDYSLIFSLPDGNFSPNCIEVYDENKVGHAFVYEQNIEIPAEFKQEV